MRYERWVPTSELRDVVEYYWCVVAPAPEVPLRAVLVPNGRSTLQLCLGDPGVRIDSFGIRRPNADVLLPATSTPLVLEQEGPSHYVGVQFTPWGARHVWPGLDREPRQVEELTGRLPPRDEVTVSPTLVLDTWLTSLLPSQPPAAAVVRAAAAVVDDAPSEIDVSDLPRHTGWSASTVYREFVHRVGMSPQRYIAIMRHRRFTDMLLGERHGDSMALLAAAAGYYDQSHASREFRRLTGMAAGEFKDTYDGIARLMALPGPGTS